MKQFFVKPGAGRKPRNLDTSRRFAPAGELMNDTPANRRLLRTGDLLIGVKTVTGDHSLQNGEVLNSKGAFVHFNAEILTLLSKGTLVSEPPGKPDTKKSKAVKH